MPQVSNAKKTELLSIARSSSIMDDMRHVAAHRHNTVLVDGKVDMDKLVEYLSDFNRFINHRPKPFRPIIDRLMKL